MHARDSAEHRAAAARRRQEDLGEGASAGQPLRSGGRSQRGLEARRRPSARSWAAPAGGAALATRSSSTTSIRSARADRRPPRISLCAARAHNLHAAEQDYGREHIDRKIAASRARHRPAAAEVLPGLF